MKTSITRTGLSSATKSSRHSGSNVTWFRSSPSTNRFMLPLRRNHLLQYRQSFRYGNLRVFTHSRPLAACRALDKRPLVAFAESPRRGDATCVPSASDPPTQTDQIHIGTAHRLII